jgi:hypothetical protein
MRMHRDSVAGWDPRVEHTDSVVLEQEAMVGGRSDKCIELLRPFLR